MYVYVFRCMYVYMCMYGVYACMHACMHACTCMYLCMHARNHFGSKRVVRAVAAQELEHTPKQQKKHSNEAKGQWEACDGKNGRRGTAKTKREAGGNQGRARGSPGGKGETTRRQGETKG